jgi:nucleoid DNA-binding protein
VKKSLIAALEAAHVLTERDLDAAVESFLTRVQPVFPLRGAR